MSSALVAKACQHVDTHSIRQINRLPLSRRNSILPAASCSVFNHFLIPRRKQQTGKEAALCRGASKKT
jgi:hypothetical protein